MQTPAPKHVGLPVAGYKSQTPEAVDQVNANKYLEEVVLRVLDDLNGREGTDLRWLGIARTHIEQGFMAMNRAVFRPGRITLPEDV